MNRSWTRCLSGCESSSGAGGRLTTDNADSTDEFDYYPCYPGYPWFDAFLLFALFASWRRIRFLELKIAFALADRVEYHSRSRVRDPRAGRAVPLEAGDIAKSGGGEQEGFVEVHRAGAGDSQGAGYD